MGEKPKITKPDKKRIIFLIFALVFLVSLSGVCIYFIRDYIDGRALMAQQAELTSLKDKAYEEELLKARELMAGDQTLGVGVQSYIDNEAMVDTGDLEAFLNYKPTVLNRYVDMYNTNSYLIGWLTVEDTVIDYPVVQTPEDEDMYLHLDFYGNANSNGTLIMDTDSVVGEGIKDNYYLNGNKPSTNLIIHGHTMKSGAMFGNLKKYHDKSYYEDHSIIKFDSLYEEREYEVIAVFESKVYNTDQTEVFKYYQFFQADTREEFDYWYDNIKSMSLYDTGVEAAYGDEFITLSCCAYHTTNGRFVVVGKRIK